MNKLKKSKALVVKKPKQIAKIKTEEKSEVKLNGRVLKKDKDYIIDKNGNIVLADFIKNTIKNLDSWSFESYYYKSINEERGQI